VGGDGGNQIRENFPIRTHFLPNFGNWRIFQTLLLILVPFEAAVFIPIPRSSLTYTSLCGVRITCKVFDFLLKIIFLIICLLTHDECF
jgi:hypothetical protein